MKVGDRVCLRARRDVRGVITARTDQIPGEERLVITLDTPRWTGTLMRWAEEVELIGVEAGQYGVTLNGRGQRVLVVHQRGEWSWCEHFDGQLGTYKTKELEKDG